MVADLADATMPGGAGFGGAHTDLPSPAAPAVPFPRWSYSNGDAMKPIRKNVETAPLAYTPFISRVQTEGVVV